ncbi:hypothetical protein FV226_05620 [Methylobacterium sp. WL12]|uniref:hypothetical protein n=1 Tax=Methylobacterium sp. WL12 TaxID=2603890 RepID=UPI0011C7FF56|nr:hypothetical protein [Methylobacterium sp. WL12]TXM74850.1 hypothetical protein FV226_05620 [Methylobacterium sp. WL12]
MDETTTTTPVSMTEAALTALRAMLEAFYEMALLLVALLLWPLRWAGIVPPRDARDVARETLAADDGIIDQAVADDEPAPLGELVRRHAMARRWAPAPGAPELAPLPPLVASWLDRMDAAQLKTLTSGVQTSSIERHLLAGAAGHLASTLGACTAEDIRARPIRTRAPEPAPIEPARIEPADELTLEQMLEMCGVDPETLAYR